MRDLINRTDEVKRRCRTILQTKAEAFTPAVNAILQPPGHVDAALALVLGTYGFHYGLGMSWGAVSTLLRRITRVHPIAGGVLTGAALSLIVDEWLTPAFGFSAPNRAYPLVTHIRGFTAHLAYGLGVALAAELLYWMGRHGGRPC